MNKLIIYIHGKGGVAQEANHYKSLFENDDVIGFDYKAQTPWEAKNEFSQFFDEVCKNYQSVEIIANSIGAFFVMNAIENKKIEKAYFISPIVDMERLIRNMMQWANVTEKQLQDKQEIQTEFGETLSWKYLCYVRNHPLKWKIPTHILYAQNDNLTSYKTILEFSKQINATLTVMEEGEHWFHTKEQMAFLDKWLKGKKL